MLAVAAIALSVFFARTKQTPAADELQSDGAVEGAVSLEAIRAAGI